MAKRLPAPGPLVPTFPELAAQVRLLGGDPRLRIGAYLVSCVLPPERGLAQPPQAILNSNSRWTAGGWRCLGMHRDAGRFVMQYLVPFVQSTFMIFNTDPVTEALGILTRAGLRLAGERSVEECAGAWLEHLWAVTEQRKPRYAVTWLTNFREPIEVDVREIPDVLAASLSEFSRQGGSHGSAKSWVDNCSPDGTLVWFGGRRFEFRPGLAADAVRALWDARGLVLSNSEIAERIGGDVDPRPFRFAEARRDHRARGMKHPAPGKGGPIERVAPGRYRIRRS